LIPSFSNINRMTQAVSIDRSGNVNSRIAELSKHVGEM